MALILNDLQEPLVVIDNVAATDLESDIGPLLLAAGLGQVLRVPLMNPPLEQWSKVFFWVQVRPLE